MGDFDYKKSEKRNVLIAACFAVLVNPMAASMLNLGLSAVQADFGCSEHSLGLVSSLFFIISVVFILPSAKLADLYGKKFVFIIGSIITAAGLILSTLSQDIYQLYVFRGLTAVGAAAISSTGVAMISDVYAPHERGGAIGIYTACVYLGASLGPTLGGILTENFGWKSIFWFLLPLTVVAGIAMFMFPYNIKFNPDSGFDMLGFLGYGIGIVVLMFGVVSLPQLFAVALIVIGSIILFAFVVFESKVKNPLFNESLFKNTSFSKSMLALFLNYAASFCVSFFLSRYLQEIGAMTPTEAGLLLMVQPLFQVILTLIAGKMSDRMDKRILPTLGMLILCAGLVLLLFLGEEINVPLLIVSNAIMGIGFGIFSAPNTNAVMSYVRKEEYSAASGLISVFRQIGMMMSMGLATCLISVMLGSDTVLVPDNYHVFMDIMRVAWYICIGMCLVGTVASWSRGSSVKQE